MTLPKPVPGLVVRYGFLWSSEADQGAVDSSKYRPCVIVLAVIEGKDGKIRVRVAPITHTPKSAETGLAIPRKLARHLGFDDGVSWISLQETNEFYWPGVDLMPVKKAERGLWTYGVLPADFFEQLKQQMKQTLSQRNTLRTDSGYRP